jgi:hypothetical protein
MRYLIAFARFWYDFIVGDDWTVALGVLIALIATLALARAGIAVWWLMPLAVLGLLTFSVRRAAG